MNFPRTFMTGLLALGLLLPSGAVAAEKVQRSTDQQGTIHIGNPNAASQPEAGQAKAEEKAKAGETAGQQKAQAKKEAPAPPPPGLLPPKTRRPYGKAAAAREKAFRKAHPTLPPVGETPAPPVRPEPAPPGPAQK